MRSLSAVQEKSTIVQSKHMFSMILNCSDVSACLTVSGRLFHNWTAAYWKEQEPYKLVLITRGARRDLCEDCRLLANKQSYLVFCIDVNLFSFPRTQRDTFPSEDDSCAFESFLLRRLWIVVLWIAIGRGRCSDLFRHAYTVQGSLVATVAFVGVRIVPLYKNPAMKWSG